MNNFIKRIYSQLNVNCTNCKESFSIEKYPEHETGCGRPPCPYQNICGRMKMDYRDYCGDACELLNQINPIRHNTDGVFEILQAYKQKNQVPGA
jgi:hypothetical protein